MATRMDYHGPGSDCSILFHRIMGVVGPAAPVASSTVQMMTLLKLLLDFWDVEMIGRTKFENIVNMQK